MHNKNKISIALILGLLSFNAAAVDAMTIELGAGDESTSRVGIAAKWDWESRWFTAGDWHLGGYWEANISHWDGDDGKTGNDTITEIGITPVFRWQQNEPSADFAPYAEIGIGAHLLSRTQIGDKRLSTSFQFGDHLGFGTRLGDKGQFDLGYRFQHYSNAGIKKPNPGINFHLLRLSYSYD